MNPIYLYADEVEGGFRITIGRSSDYIKTPQGNDLESPNEPITYKKYEIHDYAYELYGNEIYRFIDHPEGYSYDELMSMPPPEYKDMTVSEVFNTIQQVEVKNLPSKEDIINSIIEENTPDILNKSRTLSV